MRRAGTTPRALISAGVVSAVVLTGIQAPAGATSGLPEITATFTVGANPQALAITPDGRRIVTANQDVNTASIIDRSTGAVQSVATGSSPRNIAIDPAGTRAFVSNYSSGSPSVSRIDIAAASVNTSAVYRRPWTVAVTQDGTSVLTVVQEFGGFNGVERLDAVTGNQTGLTSIGGAGFLVGAPVGTDYFVSQSGIYGRGQGWLLDAATLTARPVTYLGSQIRAFQGYQPVDAVFSADGRTAFVVSSEVVSGDIPDFAVVDVASAAITTRTVLAVSPSAVARSRDGSRLFVTLGSTSSLAVLDTSGTLVNTTTLVGTPQLVEVSADGSYVLVTTTQGDLIVLDSTGTRVITTLAIGGAATDLQVSETGSFAAISVGTTNRVIIVNLPPVPASGPEVPTAALQQYAPTDGSPCGTNAPDAVDFPGIAQLRTEGWSASWAQWPNEGQGGAVCTRQPYYTSTGTWAVR